MKALIEPSGRVTGTIDGENSQDGVPIPKALADLPLDRLVYVNGKIKDAKTVKKWWVDDLGNRYPKHKPGADPILGDYDALIVRDKDTKKWRKQTAEENLAPLINNEALRRIDDVLSLKTQANISAEAIFLVRSEQNGKLKVKEKATLDAAEAARTWVRAMQLAARAMIKAADLDYADDAKWPVPSAEVITLAKEF